MASFIMKDALQHSMSKLETILDLGPVELITDEELAGLQAKPNTQQGQSLAHTNDLKSLRAVHHQVAQLRAQGMADIMVAAITGYSVQRIWQLSESPLFKELQAFYTSEENNVSIDIANRMRVAGLDAVEVMHEKILDGEVSPKDMNKFISTMFDRSGHGPSSTQKQVTIHAEGTIEELRGAIAGKGVTLRTTRDAGGTTQADHLLELGPVEQSSEDSGKAIEAPRSEGQGEDVRENGGQAPGEGAGL